MEINQGFEFLPAYPDAYITKDLPQEDITICPSCKRKLVMFEGKIYCARCYMENRGNFGKAYTKEVMDLFTTLALDKLNIEVK